MMQEARNRFDWKLSLYAAAGALVVFLPIALSSQFDIGEIVYLFLIAPIVSLIMLVVAGIKRSYSVFVMAAVYCAVSWALVHQSDSLRNTGRWLLWSKGYKTQVLGQQSPADGELRHIEWDGWGGFGAGDTSAYVVFDPADSLSEAAKTSSSGKLSGIPCGVSRVRRLESHWYSVVLYTDTDWNHCD
jgi:hypothetical protein